MQQLNNEQITQLWLLYWEEALGARGSPHGVVHRRGHEPPCVRREAHVRQVIAVSSQPSHKLSRGQVVQPHHLVIACQGYQICVAHLRYNNNNNNTKTPAQAGQSRRHHRHSTSCRLVPFAPKRNIVSRYIAKNNT